MKETKKTIIKDTQSKYWHIVIEHINNETSEITNIKLLYNYLNYASSYYAEILHNKDIDNDNPNELERPHHHIIVKYKEITRKSTIIKALSKLMNIPEKMITVKRCNDIIIETQYLIHMNNPEKYQYAPFEITTKNKEKVSEILANKIENEDITALELVEMIAKNGNRIKLLKEIGLKTYNKYFRVIEMLTTKTQLTHEEREELDINIKKEKK